MHAIITGKTGPGERETESLAMLLRACFTKQAIDQGILPDEYVFGNVFLIETVSLKPQYRGYGIGLLAVDELVKHVERASPRWSDEGLIVLDPSGLTSDLAQGQSHEEVQEMLIRYWQMLGLWVLVSETCDSIFWMEKQYVTSMTKPRKPLIETENIVMRGTVTDASLTSSAM
jgi:hypothetical protein